jgi:hypothetical protein
MHKVFAGVAAIVLLAGAMGLALGWVAGKAVERAAAAKADMAP